MPFDRQAFLALVEKAEAELSSELRKHWFLARSQPDVWRAKMEGVLLMRNRLDSLLTGK